MKRILIVLLFILMNNVFADVDSMSQDILKQIIRGPVNTNPDISDDVADQTVILSLKSASLSLACTQKNRNDSATVKKCIKDNKSKLVSSGSMFESAFNVGELAAEQQAKIHREVKLTDYYQVINTLMAYAKNLRQSDVDNNTDNLSQ